MTIPAEFFVWMGVGGGVWGTPGFFFEGAKTGVCFPRYRMCEGVYGRVVS